MQMVRLALVALLATLSACGGGSDVGDRGDDVVSTTTGDGIGARSLANVLDDPPDGDEVVVILAVLVDDGTGTRACEVLLESFPPQCGGRFLSVANPDRLDADWTEHEGVRWTDRPVTIRGRLEPDAIVVL